MHLNEREKVLYATYVLKKDARYWWETVKMRRNVQDMTWDEFIVEFNQKYYNRMAMRAQQNEFINIKQGSMSVTEVVRKFDQLARFCPYLVPNEEERVRRMLEMFRPESVERTTQENVAAGPTSYTKIPTERRSGQDGRPLNHSKQARGATHSFISNSFVDRLNWVRDRMNQSFHIALPSGEMYDYDVILGMDFLGKYNLIECRRRRVIFHPYEEQKFEFAKGKVEDVPIVRDFVDVFPEELPGLRPNREIQFEIELLPGTAPISKAPYRMAPTELKDL
ncbi:hypothetical protein UlMin_016294 [Ulmus minor]